MNTSVCIIFNEKSYPLDVGGWLVNAFLPAQETLSRVVTDEMQLRNGITVGQYKRDKKSDYDSLADKKGMSKKQHLNMVFKTEYGVDWDEGVKQLKALINEACLPLISTTSKRRLTETEQYEIAKAASNGHVSAMYWIGTALRDKNDEHCLMWLSKAHNNGHVSACFEMALFLAGNGQLLQSLQCQMISADGGFDIAFMTLFHTEPLLRMAKVESVPELEKMLDEQMSLYHYSCARYFRGVLHLARNEAAKGVVLLNEFMNNPKNHPATEHIDEVFNKHLAITRNFISGILSAINDGKNPFQSVLEACEGSSSASFNDYDDWIRLATKAIHNKP
ncbi:SEL1-like repeat protein [Yersinia enterocolitica]|uniref:hypothetical protein n=1 Tax=Yersinia enterocolitica TaxID=630 RepID=UPI0005E960B8|nr:hypothetical protein [Yersinia enterocolitica]CQH23714.1 Uncharacterised protein [Yersinia enterocolitica]